MNKDEALQKVQAFIQQRGYDYTVESLVEIYVDYFKKGFYISHTSEDCMKYLEKELEILSEVNIFD